MLSKPSSGHAVCLINITAHNSRNHFHTCMYLDRCKIVYEESLDSSKWVMYVFAKCIDLKEVFNRWCL